MIDVHGDNRKLGGAGQNQQSQRIGTAGDGADYFSARGGESATGE